MQEGQPAPGMELGGGGGQGHSHGPGSRLGKPITERSM